MVQRYNFFLKSFAVFNKIVYLCIRLTKVKGHSPVGLERCSHIAEVPGSSPGVPTEKNPSQTAGILFVDRGFKSKFSEFTNQIQ